MNFILLGRENVLPRSHHTARLQPGLDRTALSGASATHLIVEPVQITQSRHVTSLDSDSEAFNNRILIIPGS